MKNDIRNIDITHPQSYKALQQFSLFTNAAGCPHLVNHDFPDGQIVPASDTLNTFLDIPENTLPYP
jgi:hypothetical protein